MHGKCMVSAGLLFCNEAMGTIQTAAQEAIGHNLEGWTTQINVICWGMNTVGHASKPLQTTLIRLDYSLSLESYSTVS